MCTGGSEGLWVSDTWREAVRKQIEESELGRDLSDSAEILCGFYIHGFMVVQICTLLFFLSFVVIVFAVFEGS